MDRLEALFIFDRAKRLGIIKKADFFDEKFEKQHAFVADPARYLVAQCSRRAGKTTGIALRFFRTLEKYPGALCPYIALTRESAKNIMWGILQEIDSRFSVGCHFTESSLTMTHPNGARLVLYGADMENFIRRLKGIKTPGVAIDEAQDMPGHLESLVDDVLTPTLADYPDAWLALTGTPGPVPNGYFHDITAKGLRGFSRHLWSVFDNPYIPDARAFVDDIKARRQWDDNHPTLRREWGNEWVLDSNSLLIRYSPGVNHFDDLPAGKYSYILGVDFGFKDADALSVLAWNSISPDIYLVEEVIMQQQGITELVIQIEELRRRYDVVKIVVDQGGLGLKISEEIRRRFSVPLHAADKKRKMENVELLNDYLRLGKFKARKDSRFANDSYRVQIDWEHSTPDRIKVKDTFHSDAIDSTLYAFREATAWGYKPPPPKPAAGTLERKRRQDEEIWEGERQHLLEQEEREDQGLQFL